MHSPVDGYSQRSYLLLYPPGWAVEINLEAPAHHFLPLKGFPLCAPLPQTNQDLLNTLLHWLTY